MKAAVSQDIMEAKKRVVTLHSEYLFDGVLCVAQRNRGAAEWTTEHPIVGLCVVGAFVSGSGYYLGVPPHIGTRMILGEDSLSSEVVDIEIETVGEQLAA